MAKSLLIIWKKIRWTIIFIQAVNDVFKQEKVGQLTAINPEKVLDFKKNIPVKYPSFVQTAKNSI